MRRPALIKLLSAAATSMTWLFIPLYADDLGSSAIFLGVIVASYALAVFISSMIFGRAADMYGRRKIVIMGLFASSISFALLSLADTPVELLYFRFVCGFTAGMFNSALVAYVAEREAALGRFSSFGALGFTIGFVISGTIMAFETATYVIFLAASGVFFLAFLTALSLPKAPEKTFKVPRIPVAMIKKNGHLYAAMLFRHTGASIAWVIFPLYQQSLGLSRDMIAYIWVPNFAAQMLFMNYVDRFKDPHPMVKTGLFAAGSAFVVFIIFNSWWGLIPGMLILGASWSFLYIGVLKELNERNEERATATGLLNSTISLSGIIGPLIGGALAQAFGYSANIIMAAVLTYAALGVYMLVRQRSLGDKVKASRKAVRSRSTARSRAPRGIRRRRA